MRKRRRPEEEKLRSARREEGEGREDIKRGGIGLNRELMGRE